MLTSSFVDLETAVLFNSVKIASSVVAIALWQNADPLMAGSGRV
jgi:hypothetical protein